MNENDLQPPKRPCCLQELVIQLAQGCKLIYLELFMYHHHVKPEFEDLSDSDSDEDDDECAARGRRARWHTERRQRPRAALRRSSHSSLLEA